MNSTKTVRLTTMFQVALFILMIVLTLSIGEMHLSSEWAAICGWIALACMVNQILVLRRCGCRFTDFEIWFVAMSYLFMLGRFFLIGVLGVETLYSEGYDRQMLDSRYEDKLVFDSIIFVLLCIQGITCGFLLGRPKKKARIKNTAFAEKDRALYWTGVVMLLIGIPCHAYGSIRMIVQAQTHGSYSALTSSVGLIDDLSSMFIVGLLCMFFSRTLSIKKIRIILVFVAAYLFVIMATTGDRRYQTVTLIVLLIAYLKLTGVKLKWKHLLYVFPIVIFLNLFTVLRNIRAEGLVSLSELFDKYGAELFSINNQTVSQTLFEFGGSIYTVALAIRYMPVVFGYRYGMTIVSGLISLFPLGFLYQNWNIYTFGRIAEKLFTLGNTTVGSSLYQDLFANFGWMGGVLFACFFGFFLERLINRKGKIKSQESFGYVQARYYTLFYALVHFARASFTEVTRTACWNIFFLYIIYSIVRRRINDKSSN